MDAGRTAEARDESTSTVTETGTAPDAPPLIKLAHYLQARLSKLPDRCGSTLSDATVLHLDVFYSPDPRLWPDLPTGSVIAHPPSNRRFTGQRPFPSRKEPRLAARVTAVFFTFAEELHDGTVYRRHQDNGRSLCSPAEGHLLRGKADRWRPAQDDRKSDIIAVAPSISNRTLPKRRTT